MTDQQKFISALAVRVLVAAGLVAAAAGAPSARSGCYSCARDPGGGPGASCYDGSHLNGFRGAQSCTPESWGPYCYMGGYCCVGGCGGGGGSISV